MEVTQAQEAAAKSVDMALKKAKTAGLRLRVFDGQILLMTSEHLRDGRYGCHRGMNEWMNECITVGVGLNADGGAGV